MVVCISPWVPVVVTRTNGFLASCRSLSNFQQLTFLFLFFLISILQVLAAPNVKLFNAVAVEDLIVKPDDAVPDGRRVAGAVTNWTLVRR